MAMPVAHAVLVAIRPFPTLPPLHQLHQIAPISLPADLEVDAHAPVEDGHGAVHLDVADADLDDPGELAARLLVRRDAHFGSIARVDDGLDGGWEGVEAGRGEVVESVGFMGVDVGHGDAGFGRCWRGGSAGAGRLGADQGVVEESVERTMLILARFLRC